MAGFDFEYLNRPLELSVSLVTELGTERVDLERLCVEVCVEVCARLRVDLVTWAGFQEERFRFTGLPGRTGRVYSESLSEPDKRRVV